MIENITWANAHETLPDDNTTILLFAPESNEPIWIGYHEDDSFYVDDGTAVPPGSVTYWANLPYGPDA